MKRGKRAIFGWVMYDFANSAYAVVILAVIFNAYFAQEVAGGAAGTHFELLGLELTIPGASLFSFVNALAMGLVGLASPVLGALADYSGRKRRYLAWAWLTGVVSTAALAWVGAGDFWLGSTLFVISSMGFSAGSVFYDAFLPELGADSQAGRISGAGYAAGYLGGGLLLVVILLLKRHLPGFEYTHSFPLTALWWLVFALPTMLWLRDRPVDIPAGRLGGYLKIALRRVRRSLSHFRELSVLERFLLANLIYSTGIESVIRLASIFGAQELGMPQGELVLFFLVIQGTALVGAMLFGWAADRFTQRGALLATLGIWIVTLLWAWQLGLFGEARREYWLIGVLAGTAMGGSQGVSRALQSLLLPTGLESEFFGFFTLSGRLANILGMLSFGVVTWITGDMRLGIVSLLFFFVAGLILLLRVDVQEGIRQAERFRRMMASSAPRGEE
ncbi:MAG: MFS transporter [Candidatus Delongbacteria bacterium]